MKQMISMAACVLAAAVAIPVSAQQNAEPNPPASYREPLSALANSRPPALPAERQAALPVFVAQPTAGQRVARNALIFAARSAVAVVAQKQGIYGGTTAPDQPTYRPDISVPEPVTAERLCPALGTAISPAACVDRDAVFTLDRNSFVSTTGTAR